MKFNKWTLGLAAVGVVSLASAARADETNMVMTALSTTTISGYVDTAASFAPNGGGGAPNYYYGQPVNSINLNVVDIALDKPLDESPWAAGYHAEMWFGPNAAALGTSTTFGTAYGNASGKYDNTGYNSSTVQSSQAAIRQAYVTMMTPVGNGITWKLGIWDTIVGYESTTTGNNPNYTHSYGYNMEPTTHTGLLGAYKINDLASVQAGVADTSYQGGGAYTASTGTTLYRPTWLGGVTLTAPDSFGWAKGATLSVDAIITGGNTLGNYSGNGSAGHTYYAGVSLPTPIAALKFGACFDYLNAADVSQNAWDMGVYSTYQFNDKMSLNLRAEYYNGAALNTGEYYQGHTNPPLPFSGYGTEGYEEAQEITATLQYALWANVLTRLEFRVDNVNHGNGYNNNLGDGQGMRGQAFLLAAQAVYTF